MAVATDRFFNRLIRQIGDLAGAHAAREMQRRKVSFTMISAMRLEMTAPALKGHYEAALHIPHFWAVYVHEGRGPFGPKINPVMVFFRNPKDDPRLVGGKTPERVSQLQHLTGDQFRDALRLNEDHLASGGSWESRPVIVTKYIRKSTPGKFFFGVEPGQGMFGFLDSIQPKITPQVQQHFKDLMGNLLNVKMEGTLAL